jgi:hypothetical protein
VAGGHQPAARRQPAGQGVEQRAAHGVHGEVHPAAELAVEHLPEVLGVPVERSITAQPAQ